MSATVNKLVYGDLTFTDDEIQDGKVYDAVALLSDKIGRASCRERVSSPV